MYFKVRSLLGTQVITLHWPAHIDFMFQAIGAVGHVFFRPLFQSDAFFQQTRLCQLASRAFIEYALCHEHSGFDF